jgi:hypothetical protein
MSEVSHIPHSERDLSLVEGLLLSLPQVDAPIAHYFGPGIYIREAIMPAGAIAIGHRHKHEHLCVIIKGALSFIDDNGEVVIKRAPMQFVSPPGRKLASVLEDCVFWNIYATEERDIKKLEDMLFEKSDVWLDHHAQKRIEQ